jgi:putative tricarboxylic transport membrane protein
LWMLGFFGLLGYVMRKLDFPAAPLVLGLVLGDGMERALRQSLMMSQGDLTILLTRPLSVVMLLLALLVILMPLLRKVKVWRWSAADQEV